MSIGGKLKCLVGAHTRSKGRARSDGETYVSVCKYCGVRMRRTDDREWVVDKPAPRRRSVD